MYTPSREQVASLRARGNLVPIYREILADLETPVSAYLKIAQGSGSFLLESVEGGERLARYSFIGTQPRMIARFRGGATTLDWHDTSGLVRTETRSYENPLHVIRDELRGFTPVETVGLPRFIGGAVGFLSYECARYFERLPVPDQDTLDVPEAVFLFSDTLLVFDHLQHKIKVVSHVDLDGGSIDESYVKAVERIDRLVDRLRRPLSEAPALARNEHDHRQPTGFPIGDGIYSNMSVDQYEHMVLKGKEYIHSGDIIQTVLAQRFARATSAHPFAVYRALRTVNPSPYMYYLDLGDFQIVGASPELLVQVDNGVVTTHPIAGTRRRGQTVEQDAELEADLAGDEKERAEHIMLVDLGRNDIGRVSQAGSVKVTKLMQIERYSHVMHLVSHVTGKLRPDLTALDALQSCFPAGTVSGAPKIRAMEIIAELEPDRRGPYAGSVGYFSYSGNLDTCITIRTMVYKDGIAYVQAGGGIVADSVPEREYQETQNKARAMFRAIELAEQSV